LLREERVAHEFNQLDEAIKGAIRQFMAPGPDAAMLYPYDLTGAILEWVQSCKPGQVMHPLMLRDIEALLRDALWLTTRWTQAVDVYTLSRFLKRRKGGEGASQRVVMYMGDFHVRNIASLVQSMYDIHAHTKNLTLGCVDLMDEKAFMKRKHKRPDSKIWKDPKLALLDWPVTWDTANVEEEIKEIEEAAVREAVEAV
jgi:hypothetical protein